MGKRTMEGIEFTGTRIVTTAEDDPVLTTTIDEWYSKELKLIGAIDRSGPYKAYTIKAQNIHRGEPDPTLFKIPPGFRIIDLPWPPAAR